MPTWNKADLSGTNDCDFQWLRPHSPSVWSCGTWSRLLDQDKIAEKLAVFSHMTQAVRPASPLRPLYCLHARVYVVSIVPECDA
jgi:hypothetical protein